MAPTICTEKESRVRGRIRDSRRRSSGSSAINYGGKITHRRAGGIRSMTSRTANLRTLEKRSNCADEDNNSLQSSQSTEDEASNLYSSSSSLSTLTEDSSSYEYSDRLTPTNSNGEYAIPCEDQKSCDRVEKTSITQPAVALENMSRMSLSSVLNYRGHFAKTDFYQKRKNSKGLLDIAIKTIKLIKRNQLLQQKLAQLQVETRAFIESVMANPENRALRDKIQKSRSPEE